MLKRLVPFDTTSRNSNLDLVRYIQSYLDDFGIESTLVPNESGSKANLYASIGPEVPGGIVLSGHTDPTSCRSTASLGRPIPGYSRRRPTAIFMAGGRAI